MEVYGAAQERESVRRQWVAVWGVSLLLLLVFSVMAVGEADASTYYMATNGSDSNGGTSAAPFGTFSKAMGVLTAGDTLLIKDGTYYQSLTVTVSGTAAAAITIKAVNDGAVIVDGQGTREPLKIAGRSYINVEGIVFRNAVYDLVKVSGGSNHINLRRLSGYNAGVGNYHLFLIWNSSSVLVEDCVISQTSGANKAGRYGIVSFGGANHNTFRRNYVKYYSHTGGGGPCAAGADYGGSYDVWENNVFDVSEMPAGCSDVSYQFAMFGEGLYNDTSHNRWYGNVAIGGPNIEKAVLAETDGAAHSVNNWEFYNNVFLNAKVGVTNIGAADGAGWIFQNNTVAGMGGTATLWSDGSGASIATSNNSFLSAPSGVKTSNSASLTSRYNNFSAITTQYSGTISDKTGDKNIIPSYDTFTYGKGAYLMVPDALAGQGASSANMGAEVLSQYKDGVLTAQPLWPWPMEDRYYQETGRSITWEANGGLWKTLNGVYATTTPVTPPVTPPADTTAPSTPTGLTATAVSSSQINLTWVAATDNTGVAGYRVYKSGNLIATTTGKTYSDTGLLPSTIYSYSVAAFDAAGNTSAASAQVSGTTLTATSVVTSVLVLGAGYYPDIAAGYASANGRTIELQATNIAGILTANQNYVVSLVGGYDSSYANRSGGMATIINGPVTIGQGTVVMDAITIK